MGMLAARIDTVDLVSHLERRVLKERQVFMENLIQAN
jgi:hypothetical protein